MERAQKHAKEELARANGGLPSGGPLVAREPKTAFSAPMPSQLERNPERNLGGTSAPSAFPIIQRIITGMSSKSGEDIVKIHFRDVNVRDGHQGV